jgi:hypothetical protein
VRILAILSDKEGSRIHNIISSIPKPMFGPQQMLVGLLAQRRHVPFGLKEGRARCTTLRRLEERKEKKGKECMHASETTK